VPFNYTASNPGLPTSDPTILNSLNGFRVLNIHTRITSHIKHQTSNFLLLQTEVFGKPIATSFPLPGMNSCLSLPKYNAVCNECGVFPIPNATICIYKGPWGIMYANRTNVVKIMILKIGDVLES
jgi:hypothetical protein